MRLGRFKGSLLDRFNIPKDKLEKYAVNSFWMLFEKISRLLINLAVGIWVARYLGPADFGLLNLAIAIITMFLPIANFGLHGILVKELYQDPEKENQILGSTFVLKLTLSVFIIALFFLSGTIDPFKSELEEYIILVVSFSLLFQPFLILESWFESRVKAKSQAIFKTLFFFLSSGLKVMAIVLHFDIVAFAWIYSIEALFTAIALVLAYLQAGHSPTKWKFDISTISSLARKSWLLMFSGISAVIYLKIDQVMLGYLVSDTELGYYSAAVKLSEAWYFVPVVISNALFPAILSAKNSGNAIYFKRLQQLCDFYFFFGLTIALLTTLFAKPVISLLYGIEYNSSAIILKIHIWAAIFIFMRTVLSKWLITEEKYIYSLISQLSGAIVNVILNFVLIPMYGGVGAAISTIISYSITSVFILAFFKDTHDIFLVLIKSFAAPLRVFNVYEETIKKDTD